MFILLMVIHVIISFALVVSILSQSSKGGGLEGMVGNTATNMFGSQGASEFMKKITSYLGAAFFITCILVALSINQKKTVSTKAIDKLKKQQAQEAPQTQMPIETEQPVQTEKPVENTTTEDKPE